MERICMPPPPTFASRRENPGGIRETEGTLSMESALGEGLFTSIDDSCSAANLPPQTLESRSKITQAMAVDFGALFHIEFCPIKCDFQKYLVYRGIVHFTFLKVFLFLGLSAVTRRINRTNPISTAPILSPPLPSQNPPRPLDS